MGAVNGEESYDFLVAVVDGGRRHHQDGLRLNVWELVTGQVMYDSQPAVGERVVPTTAIDENQIVIHQLLGRTLEALADAAEEESFA